jgi:ABC-type lipoprotein release transport system permease subunit
VGRAIGGAGALGGTALGLLVAGNINQFFSLVEAVVNGVMGVVGAAGGFAIFSPSSFYLLTVPSQVLAREAFLVASLAVASCTLAAWAAARAVSRFRPAEVLRYE